MEPVGEMLDSLIIVDKNINSAGTAIMRDTAKEAALFNFYLSTMLLIYD